MVMVEHAGHWGIFFVSLISVVNLVNFLRFRVSITSFFDITQTTDFFVPELNPVGA